MKRVSMTVAVVLTVLLLAGCAQTGQQLRLAPDAEVDESAIGDGRTVALRVVDEREHPRLGQLENRDGEHADLVGTAEVEDVVRQAVEEGLRANGFTVSDWDADASRRLEIRVLDLDHRVSAGVSRNVSTRIELRSEGHRGESRVSGQARARDSDRITYRPSAEDNQAYLDAVLSRALGRLLNVELLEFLAAD